MKPDDWYWDCGRCSLKFETLRDAVNHERTCSKTPRVTGEAEQLQDLKARLAFLSAKSNARWSLEMRKAVDIRVKYWRSK